MKKYRYKLNMLEPGLLMLKIMAVSGLFSLLFSFLKQDALSWIFGLAAFLLFRTDADRLSLFFCFWGISE